MAAAKKEAVGKRAVGLRSGLPKAADPRFHFDIYALLLGPQELYFGHEVRVNVNVVETVRIMGPDGEEIEKCYLSPTKRRGVERRTLLWAPVNKGDHNGLELTDELDCAIPATCADVENCPICRVYGGLITEKRKVKGEEKGQTTLIGRVVHGGGVAIQDQLPEEKQRAVHPSKQSNLHQVTYFPLPLCQG